MASLRCSNTRTGSEFISIVMKLIVEVMFWPRGTSRRLQIFCNGFDSQLEPMTRKCTVWLLTRRAQAVSSLP